MKVFVCTDHAQFNPVGVASVIVAESEAHAIELLDAALRLRDLADSESHPYTLTEIALDTAQAMILRDGQY